MKRTIRCVLLLGALVPVLAQAQSLVTREQGSPFYARRYSADEYQLHDQNWAVAQDRRGVIYAANTYGVLEYDGVSWRTIDIPNELVRSVASWKDGRIYVGGISELGYLTPDSLGSMAYTSLRDAVPEAAQDFEDVWTTLATTEGVYFQTFDHILRWDGKRVASWATDDRFHKAFVVDDTYYVREEGVGLLRLVEGELEPVPGGNRFAAERIDVMLPHRDGSVLIRTRTQGFLRFDGQRFQTFATEADAYFRDKRVYHGTVLHDGTYALTTFSGSVVLMDRDGRVQRILAQDIGLNADDYVLFAMPDHQQGLWLALDDGLLRVDAPAALTILGPQSGLRGTAYEIIRHRETLYVGTTQGLFALRPGRGLDGRAGSSLEPPRFEQVEPIDEQSYALLSVGESLLAATNEGIFEIQDGRVRLVREGKAFALWQDRTTGHVLAGLKEGIAILTYDGGAWQTEGLVAAIKEEVRSLGQDEDGTLWAGTLLNGVARVGLGDSEGEVQWYGEAQGLPPGPALVWTSNDGLAFHTLNGMYRVEKTNGRGPRFIPDVALNAAIAPDGGTHYVISQRAEGGYWIAKDQQVEGYHLGEGGTLVNVTPPALHIPDVRVRAVLDEGNGIIWMASEDGLFRYDGTLGRTYASTYPALVRGVYGRDDGLLFGGTMHDGIAAPAISYDRNNLRFTFAAPTYNAPEATLYQYWLEGFDEGWSGWTPVTHKEYTNLPEDAYQFHVRARSGQGVVSQEGVYAFDVLPPWWRTWWAYTFYVLGAAFVVWTYGQMKLRQHAFELEREREVNRQLETANVRLRQANERLQQADKLKDDFLANTSHELRTPLTSILGFASVLYEELQGEARTFASMIQQGGERLLGTVNALLDMARLQADLMELEPVNFEVVAEVQRIARELEPQAEAKGLYLTVAPKIRAIPAHLDRFCLERIVSNIVGNAVKFTEEGGVTIVLDATDEALLLTVRDTGIGIGEEHLPELFGEFQQVSTGYGRSYEGNGLGLAITQRLVHLLGGDIDVESEEEHGTEVRVKLPRYDRRDGVPTVATSDSDTTERTPLSQTRVLLVESSDRPQARLQHILRATYDVDVVQGVEAGYAAAKAQAYDLLLIDSQLPPMPSGNTLLEALRLTPDHEGVMAVAVTAYSIPGDSELYQRLGFAGHIGKPITKQRVRRALDLARAAEVSEA